MKRAALLVLIEKYVEGTLEHAERALLSGAVAADRDVERAFVAEVRMARRVATTLRQRPPAELWAKIGPLLTGDEGGRRARIADGVEARIRSAGRRRVGVWAAGAVAAAALAGTLVIARSGRTPQRGSKTVAVQGASDSPAPRQVPGAAFTDDRSPSPTPTPIAGHHAGPALSRPAAGVRTAAQRWPAIVASEGEVFARRTDLLLYAAFERPRALAGLARRLSSGRVELGPGLVGRGLRVRAALSGDPDKIVGIKEALRTVGPEAPAAEGTEEAHLRYHVRFGDGFAFGPGGVLPGMCGGGCGSGKVADPRSGWRMRVRWTPLGELFFEPIPGTLPRERRWGRSLERGRWHAIEMRVRLNAPGATDGTVEGWLDGDKLISLTGLALREDRATIDGVAFDVHFRKPRRALADPEAELTIDNLAFARAPVGPREPR